MAIDLEEYLSVGEFTKLCNISKNTLVWYEKKGLLKPRIVAENGYHYYSADQFWEVDLIKSLKWADYTLSECRDYIENRTEDSFLPMMFEQQRVLEEKLEEVMRQKNTIDRTLQDYLSKKAHFSEVPIIISRPKQFLLIKKLDNLDNSEEKDYIYAIHELLELFHSCSEEYIFSSSMFTGSIITHANLLSRNFTHRSGVCLKISSKIPHPACKEIPAGMFIVGFHKGRDSHISETYVNMMEYAEQKGVRVAGDALEFDFVNHFIRRDPNEYIKEILIPVCK